MARAENRSQREEAARRDRHLAQLAAVEDEAVARGVLAAQQLVVEADPRGQRERGRLAVEEAVGSPLDREAVVAGRCAGCRRPRSAASSTVTATGARAVARLFQRVGDRQAGDAAAQDDHARQRRLAQGATSRQAADGAQAERADGDQVGERPQPAVVQVQRRRAREATTPGLGHGVRQFAIQLVEGLDVLAGEAHGHHQQVGDAGLGPARRRSPGWGGRPSAPGRPCSGRRGAASRRRRAARSSQPASTRVRGPGVHRRHGGAGLPDVRVAVATESLRQGVRRVDQGAARRVDARALPARERRGRAPRRAPPGSRPAAATGAPRATPACGAAARRARSRSTRLVPVVAALYCG